MFCKNHYEAAFEHYLQKNRIPYFANGQEYRNRFDDDITLKNFDYVVSTRTKWNWIIDVKGRKFPGLGRSRRYWKHWTTQDDLSGMLRWESFLGQTFRGLFVFAYWLQADRSPVPPEQLFRWRNGLYAFVAIDVHAYLAEARLISPKWQTYEMPVKKFRAQARPFTDFIV
ncbi:MAG: HYExAFE family protein [Planctomycetia bacterium]|nr:HYExAFE family protein [Planctomycetia bacterium]